MNSSSLQKLVSSPWSVGPKSPAPFPPSRGFSRAVGLLTIGAVTLTSAGAQDAPKPAPADEVVELDTLEITARNRSEKAQDVPISVSALDSKALERESLVSTGQFTSRLPNVTYFDSNTKQTNISIRGIGKNASNERFETSVGFIVDDVYLAAPGSAASDFIELDRVEVLRGPQGTLKGKNTTLGVVSVTTKAPSFTQANWVEVGAGIKDFLSFKGGSTGPIIENKLAYRVSVNARQGDGYFENPVKGDTLNDINRYAASFQLLATPSETFTAKTTYDHSESDEHAIFNSVYIADPTTFTNGSPRATISQRYARDYFQSRYVWDPSKNDFDHHYADNNTGVRTYRDTGALHLIKEINDWQFTSISAASHFSFDPGNDSNPYEILRAGSTQVSDQLSQEFRVTSPLGEKIDYQGGLYYLKNDYEVTPPYGYGYKRDDGALQATNPQYASLNSSAAGRELMQASLNGIKLGTFTNTGSESYAPYFQSNIHFTEKLTLTAGVRYTVEERYYDSETVLVQAGQDLDALAASNGATLAQLNNAKAIRTNVIKPTALVAGDTKNESLGWLLNPSYKLTKTSLAYGVVSYGEKSAVIAKDNAGNIATIDPETALNFELGAKNTFFNNRLRLNGNLFRTIVSNYQTTIRQLDLVKNDGSYASYDGNVPEIVSQGVELDGAYAINKYLNLNFSAAYTDAYYSDFKNGAAPPEVTGVPFVDYTGEQLAGSSKYSYSVGLDSSVNIGGGRRIFGSVTNTYRSAYALSNTLSQYQNQDAVFLYDASLGYSYGNGKYSITLVGKNILDEKYFVTGSDGGAATAASAGSVYTGSPGQRRFIAVAFKALF